ncbi:unnamed protein product [Cuscuta campestris]|uniref:FANCI solenoid 2 domain-containing protein n=1 Tax=Cuscuta campestris TaxID=132261 RepID=A0A484LL58_9ASTE|nr:unnamed protein product [Cuscuta campestris]
MVSFLVNIHIVLCIYSFRSRKAALGREHVVSSIVKLGFGLLEGVEEKSSEQIKYDCIAGPVELGLEVLKSLFDLHDGVRNEIIQQCNLQILSSKPGVMPIIRLLGDLVQSHPHPLLQRASDLKKLFENFTFSNSEMQPCPKNPFCVENFEKENPPGSY